MLGISSNVLALMEKSCCCEWWLEPRTARKKTQHCIKSSRLSPACPWECPALFELFHSFLRGLPFGWHVYCFWYHQHWTGQWVQCASYYLSAFGWLCSVLISSSAPLSPALISCPLRQIQMNSALHCTKPSLFLKYCSNVHYYSTKTQ